MLLRLFAAVGVSAFVTGCTTVTDFVSSNIPDSESGPSSIVVRLGEQRAYLYKGGKEVAVSRVSTGRKGYRTPRGKFRVIRKDRDHRSSLYGDYVDEFVREVDRIQVHQPDPVDPIEFLQLFE